MALGAEKCSFLQYQDKEGGPMGFVFLVAVSGSWLCPSTELPPGICSQRPLGPGLHRVATGTRGRVRECGHEEAWCALMLGQPSPQTRSPTISSHLSLQPCPRALCVVGETNPEAAAQARAERRERTRRRAGGAGSLAEVWRSEAATGEDTPRRGNFVRQLVGGARRGPQSLSTGWAVILEVQAAKLSRRRLALV